MNRLLIIIAFALLSSEVMAQPTPAEEQKGSILIVGATAHIGNGDRINNSAVGFENGVITYVGREEQVKRSNFDEVIEADGMDLYPGFIAPNSTLGLMEIGAVRATRDYREVGRFKPNVRTAIAYNTDSEITPTVRSNGVLLAQITPRGGVIYGMSSIVQFDAWNWEDALLREDDGIHLRWPRVYSMFGFYSKKTGIQEVEDYDEQVRAIEDFFTAAKAYSLTDSPEEIEVKYEAMQAIFSGEKTLYGHAQGAKEISELIHFKKAFDIPKLVIVGGAESWLVADLLRDNDVSVMIQRLHRLPRYEDEDVDQSYKLPKLLQDEGVTFCLENSGDMEQMGTRNLPFYAGTAHAYGLTYEQAVASITLNTAKILGIDDRCGSIEKGKDATLILSEGDALDMRSNQLTHAFIQGRSIDLDNRQKQLYRKFRDKYQQ